MFDTLIFCFTSVTELLYPVTDLFACHGSDPMWAVSRLSVVPLNIEETVAGGGGRLQELLNHGAYDNIRC